MQKNYIQKFCNDENKPVKVICLAVCILLDLIILTGVITCLSTKKYVDLVIYAAIFVVTVIIRLSSLFFTFEVVIHYKDGNITIIKIYPIKNIILYEGQASGLKIEEYSAKANETAKCVRLCPKSCEKRLYMIELSERKYLICLDDYLFSLIEVSRDLS